MNTTATQTQLDVVAFGELERSFRGQLVRPREASYDEHRRVWNGSIDRFPALIARCTGVADVIAAVRFARNTGLQVAVRSGGHSFPGLSVCDGGVVIDLGPMKGIRVDPQARTARAQAGVLWGELDRETQAFGLATTGGIVTHTGVAGLTLGGGIGWLQRKQGLTIDQLISVDLVTADSEFLTASEIENADLFWGLRGGGGNFGIVTEFEFRLHPVGPIVLAGPVFWPMDEAPELLRFYRQWSAEAPDELMTIVVQRKAPPVPFVPTELHGKPVVSVACCYAGDVEEGEQVVRPLKGFGSPVIDLCEPKPYVTHQAMFDPSFPHDWWYYMRACDVAELSDAVIDIAIEHALEIRSPLTTFPIWQLGGAVARVADEEAAFSGRGAGHTFNITGMTATAEGFDAEREWVRSFWSVLEPHQTSVYVNFLMEEGQERVRQAYGREKYERLRALKRKYDPENFFRHNQNIPPT
ncbi:MAG: FAD-binding oxidoreductase [Actinobacteria bacterium]|nr:FAD-binding oxidoreductase [Actinomycetota bacterium]